MNIDWSSPWKSQPHPSKNPFEMPLNPLSLQNDATATLQSCVFFPFFYFFFNLFSITLSRSLSIHGDGRHNRKGFFLLSSDHPQSPPIISFFPFWIYALSNFFLSCDCQIFFSFPMVFSSLFWIITFLFLSIPLINHHPTILILFSKMVPSFQRCSFLSRFSDHTFLFFSIPLIPITSWLSEFSFL